MAPPRVHGSILLLVCVIVVLIPVRADPTPLIASANIISNDTLQAILRNTLSVTLELSGLTYPLATVRLLTETDVFIVCQNTTVNNTSEPPPNPWTVNPTPDTCPEAVNGTVSIAFQRVSRCCYPFTHLIEDIETTDAVEVVQVFVVNASAYPPSTSLVASGPIELISGYADPHFQGFLGQKFDFMGSGPDNVTGAWPDESGFVVNGRFAHRVDDEKWGPNATVISAVSVRLGFNSPWLEVGSSIGSKSAKWDGVAIDSAEGEVVQLDESVNITRSWKDAGWNSPMVTMSAPDCYIRIHHGMYIDLQLNSIRQAFLIASASFLLSTQAHGVLGQTVRAKRDEWGHIIMWGEGRNGRGVIDGTPTDYEVASLDDATTFAASMAKLSINDHQARARALLMRGDYAKWLTVSAQVHGGE
eukprot:jgi/Chlat1/3178/Chrsp22S03408